MLFAAYRSAWPCSWSSSLIDLRNARELDTSSGKVSRTLERIDKLRQIGNTLCTSPRPPSAASLTGNEVYLQPYRDMQQRIPVRLAEIDQLVGDEAAQRAPRSTGCAA